MSKNPFDPNSVMEKLKSLQNAAQGSLLNINQPQNVKVQIRPDNKVPRGLFLPDPLIPGGHKAHPITIQAIRKDIFLAGEAFVDLEMIYQCQSCKQELDLQFWHFCPYCEAAFPKDAGQR